ncbi:MAG TPA: addiction module protein [Pirellulaceae bacterium]|jgi:putative addiction module component (TIGR02574 family)
MSRTAEEFLEAAMALTEEERAEVAARLQESVSPFATQEIAAAWKKEIARRIQEADEGIVPSIPEEEVDRLLKEKYGFLAD